LSNDFYTASPAAINIEQLVKSGWKREISAKIGSAKSEQMGQPCSNFLYLPRRAGQVYRLLKNHLAGWKKKAPKQTEWFLYT
jgi:hypothetical protein